MSLSLAVPLGAVPSPGVGDPSQEALLETVIPRNIGKARRR
jgi:hypothetical protein